jgi:pyruvate/2-oxoglutarate dehydrogenase complex dihydrolipoamide dehydrogenase (E3) component
MTLAGGALFGFVKALVIVSFASKSGGALLAFLIARLLLRDWVQARFGTSLESINRGVEKDGALYLFTLRLVPAFPFFVVNLAMALTALPARTFYWVSQLGMLAGTVVFVNAGTQLAQVESLSGILSPGLIGAFVLLGIFPLIARKLIDIVRARSVFKRWPKPAPFDYNMVVIGGGSAGLVTAYIGAAVKARFALIEQHRMGGDCLNTGCVPSKALIRSARLLSQIADAPSLGVREASAKFDFADVMERVSRVVATSNPMIRSSATPGSVWIVWTRRARITSPWTVEVKRQTAHPHADHAQHRHRSRRPAFRSADSGHRRHGAAHVGHAVVAARPARPAAGARRRPDRLRAVAGLRTLRRESDPGRNGARLMAREDPDVSALVEAKFASEGISVLTGHKAVRFAREARCKGALCRGSRQARCASNSTRCCARSVARPMSGLRPGRTRHQACAATARSIPTTTWKRLATFTEPEVARVGVNETEAKEKGIAYEVARYDIDDLDRAIADSEAHGFIKVLTVPGKDRILGVTIVGEHAGDLIAEYVLAMKHGIGLNKILGTIHIYPTLAEANKYVAGVWKKAHAPQALLEWVRRFHAWRRGA